MFDTEPKSAPVSETTPLTKDTPRPHRRTIRPVSRVDSRAVLMFDEGMLRVEVLAYDGPEATYAEDRLVVSLEWDCAVANGRYEGPLFYADEIAAWADRIASVSVEGSEFSITEPDFRVACLARDWNGDLILSIDFLRASTPFSLTVEIGYGAWKAFGRAMQRIARAFPQREPRTLREAA